MTTKHRHSSHQTSHGRQPAWWPGIVLCVLVASLPLTLAAQRAEEAEDAGDSSQHVEESDEAYRRRMETQEGGGQADVIPGGVAGNGTDDIDALPLESRKHLRDEMRNVIMEQGEWKPENANKIYPYNPSAAAQGDPDLRHKEEKAWGELVQEYHKREAAALAAGNGRNPGSEAGQAGSQTGGGSQAGNQSGNQSGGQSGNDSGAVAGSSSASRASRSQSPQRPDSRSEEDAADSSAAGAGVSQSALEFLLGQAGGQSGGQAGGKPAAGSAGDAGQQPQNGAAGANASSAGQQQSQAGSESDSAQSPPGSVAIEELRAAENAGGNATAEASEAGAAASAAAGSPANITSNSVVLSSSSADDKPSQRPGTVAIPELEKLPGMDQNVQPPVEKKNP